MTSGLKTSLYAAMLAAAGLPLYLHLPRFATAELGLSLATVGVILIAIRILDFVQDPFLGWLVDRMPTRRRALAAIAAIGLAGGFAMLFSISPPIPTIPWIILALVLLFSAYSLATILIYGQSVQLAEASGQSQFSIAAYREAGLVAGVVLAAIAPAILEALGIEPYTSFGLILAGFAVFAWLLTRSLWQQPAPRLPGLRFSDLRQAGASPLLALAFVNALPVALTSTLFLFFVEDRLNLAGQAGLFLVVFFVSAGLAAPVWSALTRRIEPLKLLSGAMLLSIVGFIGAAMLSGGEAVAFGAICIVTGIATGADLVIISGLFAKRLAEADLPTGQAFGLWAFVTKAALAIAAVTALPLLQFAGFAPGAPNAPDALRTLTFAYAFLPCVLKFLALALVLRLAATNKLATA